MMTVTRLCALYGVTRAGYYAWRHRPASPRREQDRVLMQAMGTIFEKSGGTYGSPRLHRALSERGHRISRRRVERLMREGGWRARLVRVTAARRGRIDGSLGPSDTSWSGGSVYFIEGGSPVRCTPWSCGSRLRAPATLVNPRYRACS